MLRLPGSGAGRPFWEVRRRTPPAGGARTLVKEAWRWLRCGAFQAGRSRSGGCMTAAESLPLSGWRPGNPALLPTRFGLSWPAGKEGEGAAHLEERNFPPGVEAELGHRKWVGPRRWA